MVFSFLWMGIWSNLFDLTSMTSLLYQFTPGFFVNLFWLSYEITTCSILLVSCVLIWILSTSGSPQKKRRKKLINMMNVCDGDRLSFVFLWSTSRRGYKRNVSSYHLIDCIHILQQRQQGHNCQDWLVPPLSLSLFLTPESRSCAYNVRIKHGGRRLYQFVLCINYYWILFW